MVTSDDIIELLEFVDANGTLGAGIGVGDRFNRAIERVRAVVNRQGTDRIRTLKDMMKSALMTYVRNTQDVVTGREIFHRAIMSGGDTMMTVTGAAILANALAGRHKDQAQTLMKGVAGRLSGPQRPGMQENASGAAVSAGAIATVSMGKKKKRREDSIFAEQLTWDDLVGEPAVIDKLYEIVASGQDKLIETTIIDPATAELILAVHGAMAPDKQKRYANKSIEEMVQIAEWAVQRGIIQIVVE